MLWPYDPNGWPSIDCPNCGATDGEPCAAECSPVDASANHLAADIGNRLDHRVASARANEMEDVCPF